MVVMPIGLLIALKLNLIFIFILGGAAITWGFKK